MTQSLDLLDGHKYISLITFRKNGEPKPTAVWFTTIDGNIYVYTRPDSWKVKRIKNNSTVEMIPCKTNGDLIGTDKLTGTARLLAENEEPAVDQSFKKKYGLMKSIFGIFDRLRGDQRVFIEITPQVEHANG